MDWNLLYSEKEPPSWEQIAEYINDPLWTVFNQRIQSAYHCDPRLEYSRCSMQAGWNIKYKKSGRSLCTLYPMQGYFIALVVIGSRELTEAELLIFVLLSALGSADLQVNSHAAGALKAGCTKEDLLASLLHAMPYMGFPRMLNALNSLRPLF